MLHTTLVALLTAPAAAFVTPGRIIAPSRARSARSASVRLGEFTEQAGAVGGGSLVGERQLDATSLGSLWRARATDRHHRVLRGWPARGEGDGLLRRADDQVRGGGLVDRKGWEVPISAATRRLGAKRCDAGCRRALLQRGVLGPAARAARRPDDQATQDGVPALLADADPGVVHGGHLHGEARHRDGGKGPARTGVIRRSGSAFAETGGSERARDARRAPGRHRAPSRRLPGRALALAPLLQRCAVQPLIGRRLRAATLSLPRSIA
eukprot:scaffold16244_cov60-Phaeocystis_antarctica.AAC.6